MRPLKLKKLFGNAAAAGTIGLAALGTGGTAVANAAPVQNVPAGITIDINHHGYWQCGQGVSATWNQNINRNGINGSTSAHGPCGYGGSVSYSGIGSGHGSVTVSGNHGSRISIRR